MVKVSKTLNNIDIGNTQECNLLCKLIIDYIPSKKVILEQKYNEDDTSSKCQKAKKWVLN